MNRPLRRDVHGIVLLDKPTGLTSNAALQKVKRLFAARKAGHTGSLDPLASGLLPVCMGDATKVSGFLLNARKRYLVTALVGARTDTGDADGTVVETSPARLTARQVAALASQFCGQIEQVPPMYSALKHKGKRLYELARKGIEISRPPRSITVYSIHVTAWDEAGFTLDVTCSKGTYVRTLIEDIAGSGGALAHVRALRRTQVGPYTETDKTATLDQLGELAERGADCLDGVLLGVDSAIADWPQVNLGQDSAWYLQQGQPVTVPRAPSSGWVRLYAENSRFLGMGEVLSDGRIAPRRLFRRAGSC